jgi:hypothetical protein
MLTFKFKPYHVDRHAHCYGWDYTIHKLHNLLPQDEAGIVLDDFVDSFLYDPDKKPHLLPWIGILHNAPTTPQHLTEKTLDDLLQSPKLIESLPHCKLLIVLCNTSKKFLQNRVNIPIKVVYHPKDSFCHFDLDSYLYRPMLFHAGFCRRNYAEYYRLNTQITRSLYISLDWHLNLLKGDLKFHNISMRKFRKKINVYNRFLSNEEYLTLLRSQISFCWLYDCAASNAILESIMSRAPIVVNKLPAVVEYLGDDYPLYYENIKQDPDKYMLDRKVLSTTVDYLARRSHLFHFDRFSRFFLELRPSDLLLTVSHEPTASSDHAVISPTQPFLISRHDPAYETSGVERRLPKQRPDLSLRARLEFAHRKTRHFQAHPGEYLGPVGVSQRLKGLAKDLLPPVVIRLIRRTRNRL